MLMVVEWQATDEVNGIPTWLVDDVVSFGLDVLLDLTFELTKNFTGDYFYEELQGMADAAQIDFQTLGNT
jgi:isopenicillin-N N-acyltransferase-like protein